MKRDKYEYTTKFGKKTCEAADAFDINKALQRAFTKAIAMHGIGLYVYRGEDLPDEIIEEDEEVSPPIEVDKNGNPIIKQTEEEIEAWREAYFQDLSYRVWKVSSIENLQEAYDFIKTKAKQLGQERFNKIVALVKSRKTELEADEIIQNEDQTTVEWYIEEVKWEMPPKNSSETESLEEKMIKDVQNKKNAQKSK